MVRIEEGVTPAVGLSIARGWAHETLGTRGTTARLLAWLATTAPTDTTWWEVGPTVSTIGVVGEADRAVPAMRTIVSRLDEAPGLGTARPFRPFEPDGGALQRRWGWRGFGLLVAPHLGHADLDEERSAAWLAGVGTRSATLWVRNLAVPDGLALTREGHAPVAVDPAWRGELPREEAAVDSLFTVSWLEGRGTASALVSRWWAHHLLDLLPDPAPGQPALEAIRRPLLPGLGHVSLAATGRVEPDDVEVVRDALRRLRSVDPPVRDHDPASVPTPDVPGVPPDVWTRLWGTPPGPVDDAWDAAAVARAREGIAASLLTMVPRDLADDIGLAATSPGRGVEVEGRPHPPVRGARQVLAMPRRRLTASTAGVALAWHPDRSPTPERVGVRAGDVATVVRWEDGQRMVVGVDDTRLVLDPAYWSHADTWVPVVDDLAPEVVDVDGDGPTAPWSEFAARSVLGGWGAWLAVVLFGAVAVGYAVYGLVGDVASEEVPYLLVLVLLPGLLAAWTLPTAWSWLQLRRRVARQLGGRDRLLADLSPPPTR